MGMKFSINESYLSLGAKPTIVEAFCFWRKWTYKVSFAFKSIDSIKIKGFFGIPYVVFKVSHQNQNLTYRVSLASANYEERQAIYQLQSKSGISNQIQIQKYLAKRSSASFFLESMPAIEFPLPIEPQLDYINLKTVTAA